MKCNKSRPTIVFDLDDTLVHVTPIAPNDIDNISYFTIHVHKRKYYVHMRPNLQIFLDKTSKLFDICVFTASERKYANKIIDKILPNVKNSSRFFRDSCISFSGYFVKDLSVIKSPIKKTLIVDDIAGSALNNPKNLIKIKPWIGEKDDNVLNNLILILESIALNNDLRASFNEIIKNGKFEGIETFKH